MGKITVSKFFDENDIKDDAVREAIKPLVSYMNSAFDNVIRAIQGDLTLGTNVKGTLQTFSVKHNTATSLAVDGTFVGAIPLYVLDTGIGIDSYTLRVPDTGQVEVTFQFTDTSDTSRSVRMFFFTA